MLSLPVKERWIAAVDPEHLCELKLGELFQPPRLQKAGTEADRNMGHIPFLREGRSSCI